MGVHYNHPLYYSSSYQEFKKIEIIFREFLSKSKDADKLFVLGKVYDLLAMLLKNSENKTVEKTSKHNQLTQSVVDYIIHNYTSIAKAQDVAYHFQLSNSHLATLFKNEYGMTLNKFLSDFKMRKAQELLRQKELSVAEIADELNYSNQFNFSRAFKNEFGISPTKWRELHIPSDVSQTQLHE